MAEKSTKATKTTKPTGLLKNKWLASLVSLIAGLGVGTTLGREVLDTAGIPASCVRALQRADTAISTGKSIGDNGKAALDAVTSLHIGDAGNLLSKAKDDALKLVDEAKHFNKSRKTCNNDRK